MKYSANYKLGIKTLKDKEYNKAFNYFSVGAEQNDVDCINALGSCYFGGEVVKQDYKKGIYYYEKAKEMGSLKAKYNLAYAYYKGYGVKQDYKKAYMLYHSCAVHNDADALFKVGYLHLVEYDKLWHSYTKEEHKKQAFHFLSMSASMNNIDAQYYLGQMYCYGEGTETDYVEGCKWLLKAAKQGHKGAYDFLVKDYIPSYFYTKRQNEQIDKLYFKNEKTIHDITFSTSVCGCLKVATRNDKVYYVLPELEMGSIVGDLKTIRKQNMKEFFGTRKNFYCKNENKNMSIIQKAVEKGDILRVWLDTTPNSLCGFYFLCHMIKNKNCNLQVVYFPEELPHNRIMGCDRCWGELDHRQLSQYVNKAATLDEDEIIDYALEWDLLVKDNKKLRVRYDDEIHSVDEDYFDHLFFDSYKNGEIVQLGHIIGMVMGNDKHIISSSFIDYRINHFINVGKMIVVSDDENYYSIKVKIVK